MKNFLRSSHLYLGTDKRNRHGKYISTHYIMHWKKHWCILSDRNAEKFKTSSSLWYCRHFLTALLSLGIKTKVTKMIDVLVSRNLKKILANYLCLIERRAFKNNQQLGCKEKQMLEFFRFSFYTILMSPKCYHRLPILQ
jgi:hypothetical protein